MIDPVVREHHVSAMCEMITVSMSSYNVQVISILITHASLPQIFGIETVLRIRLSAGWLLHFGHLSRTGDIQQFGVEQAQRCQYAFVTHLNCVLQLRFTDARKLECFLLGSANVLTNGWWNI